MILNTKRADALILDRREEKEDPYASPDAGEELPEPTGRPHRVSRWLLQWQTPDGVQHALDFDNSERAESEGEFRLAQGMIQGEFVVWRHYEEA